MSAAFRALSLGVGSFDKSRFGPQVDVFDRQERQDQGSQQPSSVAGPSTLPAELDFFGSSSGSNAKGLPSAHSVRSGADGDIGEELKKSNKKRKRELAAKQVPSLDSTTLKAYLRKHRLNISGTDFPRPLVSWAEAGQRYGIPDWMISELESRGWDLTGVQRAALSIAFERRDLLAMAPTGSGKTLAYLLPLVHQIYKDRAARAGSKKAPSPGPRALILSPTRELATQIYDETRRLLQASPEGQEEAARSRPGAIVGKKASKGVRIALLTGGERIRAVEEAEKEASTGGQGAKFDVLISTPLRLVQAVEVEGWSLANVTQVILDEADTLLSAAFLKQTDLLLSLCTSPSLQKSLFSATLPSSVETLSKSFLAPDYIRVIVGAKDSSSEDVSQKLKYVGTEEGKLLELRTMLKMGEVKPPTLLFVQSIERAKDLYNELVYDGLRIDTVHSDLSRTQREGVISSFKRGEIWLLICTEVLSRGLDFKGVELVLNYDFPLSTESYIHRIGRTGRAGRKGRAVTFFTKEDAPNLRSILNIIKQSNPEAATEGNIPQYLLNLPKVGRKEKRRLKRKVVERQSVGEASGSRVKELDEKERREGRRLMEKKGRTEAKAGQQKKKNKSQQSEAVSSDEDESD
ncbi:P-loop containing nucleoside triphosphate hydrolase protein [Microstroma glucosiphilum]|uniref:RNA helicase n=1 Tax=Pseudomicrostroma glucosiphilum TaxID=1684307 RepID=A0A316UC53_9BASI|nr:P-loop containing nucleoside triphosphate hydrolase protein [Pseudomicrostroma glucosiphilum]PWN22444.1 P-loop containing nucleoside triphosphate hydrolase protein [Pseudomicrostroma glucosiphilum]